MTRTGKKLVIYEKTIATSQFQFQFLSKQNVVISHLQSLLKPNLYNLQKVKEILKSKLQHDIDMSVVASTYPADTLL